jgi:hypothetical protein
MVGLRREGSLLDRADKQGLIARHVRNSHCPLDTHGKMDKAIVEKRVESVGRAAEIGTPTPKNKKMQKFAGSGTNLKSTLTNQSQNKRL